MPDCWLPWIWLKASRRCKAACLAAMPKAGCCQHVFKPDIGQRLAGRWVSPFRAVWSPGSDGVVVGNMKRTACPAAPCLVVTSSA